MYTVRYTRPTADSRLELCQLDHEGPLPPAWLASGFVVNWVAGGEADLRARGADHRVARGMIVLADAGEFRRVTRRLSVRASTRSVTVDPTLLREAIESRTRHTATPHFASNTSQNPRLIQALSHLYTQVDTRASRLGVETAVEQLFDSLARDLDLFWDERWPAHTGVRRARALIDDCSATDFGLAELCAESGLSRAHLIRAFARDVGVTPHQYQLHRRVQHARSLLAAGRPAADVAAAVGFCDQSHLTRHFSRMMGIGPAAYQRAIRLRP